MQTAELKAGIGDCAGQAYYYLTLALLDSGAIHAGIDVDKNPHLAVAPLPDLFLVFGKNGNTNVRKLPRYVLHAARVRTHDRIGEQHVGGAVLAGDQELQRGRALEVVHAALHQHTQSESELRSLEVRAPTVCVTVQQLQSSRDVCGNVIGIHNQRWSQYLFDAGHTITLVPVEFAQHNLLNVIRSI